MSNLSVLAIVITIGDEILYGQILDTNAQWISAQLDEAGVQVVQRISIGDNEKDILETIAFAEQKADLVLITGGLGPTADDLTKPSLAKYFNVPLSTNDEALNDLKVIFQQLDREITPTNRAQADLPSNCLPLSNKVGTAPGMWFDERDTVFVSMPGVPFEMKKLMTDQVLPRLHQRFKTPVVIHRIVRTVGIGESWLSDKLSDWENALPETIKLAYLPNLGQVRLRLTSMGQNKEKIQTAISKEIEKLKPLIGQYIYGYDDDVLAEVVGRRLNQLKFSIATAESCTGGLIAHMITAIPGSSNYFKGSIVAYDNRVKINQLGVSENILQTEGAVSEDTVIAMAKGVCRQLNTDVGVASSGVAGPDGGTDDKPVGTIWIAVNTPVGHETKKLSLFKNRQLNIETTSIAALALTFQCLKQIQGKI